MTTWMIVLLIAVILVILVLLVALAWAIVGWRRRRAAAAGPRPTGPSTSEQLRALWQPFYRHLPMRALHFPTVVVMGDAGVGKTHLIGCHVDWRGQSHQFRPSVDRGTALQLYLGPEIVVHELSAAVLRDVGQPMKRALRSLWSNMGPSATVVLALDARTLLATPPAALRELAQLARGKISLFPARCRAGVDVRIHLGHLDQIDGYPEFAAAIGADYGALELGASGDGRADAERLVATFDAHLAHALTSRTGEEFDRLVRFYAVLPQLIAALTPMLEALRGKDELFAERHPASALYLGSLLPRSHVGEPFAVDRGLIRKSLGRQRRRGLRGSLALAAGLTAVEVLLMAWHAGRIAAAERAIAEFESIQDHQHDVDEGETRAAENVVAAKDAMRDSEILWLRWSYRPDKVHVDDHFEQVIREAYLEPRLSNHDRIELLFVTALIYASHDNDLGRLVLANPTMWADELGLTEWMIEAYVESSLEPYARAVELPAEHDLTGGREWSDYLIDLVGMLRDTTISPEEAARLTANLPKLRGLHQYEVLAELLAIFADDPLLADRLAPLLAGRIDHWSGSNYEGIAALRAMISTLEITTKETGDWGLAQLVRELGRPASPGATPRSLIETENFQVDSAVFEAVVVRTRRHELIAAVLDRLARTRPLGGREFFATDASYPDAGVVHGFGAGSQSKISGVYTKASFEAEVAPVLRFAATQLSVDAEPSAEPGADVIALTDEDRRRLDQVIRTATGSYAAAYQRELINYYEGFEFDPGSDVALPFAIKAFAQSSSWFTEFLLAVSRNAALDLPAAEDDAYEYFEPMKLALDDFAPLVALLAEDAGQTPGLEPYQVLIADLQKRVTAAVGESGDPEADTLVPRLSALGSLALGVAKGTDKDHEAMIGDWLYGAGLDPSWYGPFLAPAEAVRERGLLDIRAKVATAWLYDVRPLVDPLLTKYPFDPSAGEDAGVDELESIARRQAEPGTFWDGFDRLIRPAMATGELAMIEGVVAPGGMMAMTRDLERLSTMLWNEEGERVPLEVVLRIEALPSDVHDGKVASMAVISSGGASVFGFNQRPEPQTMQIEWWDQGASVVLLKMTAPESNGRDESRYRLVTEGTFSFHRLLDLGVSRDFGKLVTPTEMAISRATRCDRRPAGTRRLSMAWPVVVDTAGNEVRSVSVVIDSDPWVAFAIRDCR
ncbi:hypothetical protein ACNOYE_02135 [Nannocystaceae bacterium ST9]